MRHDYAASADLCEENGFVESARVLREVAEGKCGAFMVRPTDTYEYGTVVEMLGLPVDQTRRLFFSQEAAERYAADLKAIALRVFSPESFMRPYLFEGSMSESEFCRRVGAILKADYRLPRDLPAPLFPEWASHEQLRDIAPLLAAEFFEVVIIPIVPEDEES